MRPTRPLPPLLPPMEWGPPQLFKRPQRQQREASSPQTAVTFDDLINGGTTAMADKQTDGMGSVKGEQLV
ncbi:predicted protein [Lichtheimia corymbifera JMRC:FSU:9682]|uniref:Uncharacterized protein n=1 Tax=Lichtheimia corymbifera JMRC:FSU:9682 TaxID=1263082 RepID=A0A068RVU3_9FUNG|nr:predicted protein [Lichtheimia corymbifera JMRC:FSU:9682]